MDGASPPGDKSPGYELRRMNPAFVWTELLCRYGRFPVYAVRSSAGIVVLCR
ncbi:MAG: hypothetical protein QOJ16_13 [Acidobacteriota bacterium]|jgi:hypothetical protein|nr:hypothetical protein [Acidobacteriota bacterium]